MQIVTRVYYIASFQLDSQYPRQLLASTVPGNTQMRLPGRLPQHACRSYFAGTADFADSCSECTPATTAIISTDTNPTPGHPLSK
jgi:hypothetical protein